VRAREWETQGRNDSFVLRGDDLNEAEAKLAQSERDPRPTDLQRQYVLASRKSASRRQRLVIIGVTFALIVAVGLAIFAFVLFQRSLRAEAQAKEQARIALSRQLAAQALASLDDQFDLALLLSLEANHITDTVEARSSLLTTVGHQPHLTAFLHGHDGPVNSLAFSPDSDSQILILASASDDNTIRLWDVTTGKQLDEPLIGHDGPVNSLAFSPDGQILASGSDDNTIILWDMTGPDDEEGQFLYSKRDPLSGHDGRVTNLAFDPNGQILASGSEDRTIILWDLTTGEQLDEPLIGHDHPVTGLTFRPGGQILASSSCGELGPSQTFSPPPCILGEIRLWDVASRRLLGEPLTGHNARVHSLAFSPDGQILASASDSGYSNDNNDAVILWDLNFESWQEQACRRANRKLTLSERDRFIGPETAYKCTDLDLPAEN
jgi:WD40 repeat protein